MIHLPDMLGEYLLPLLVLVPLALLLVLLARRQDDEPWQTRERLPADPPPRPPAAPAPLGRSDASAPAFAPPAPVTAVAAAPAVGPAPVAGAAAPIDDTVPMPFLADTHYASPPSFDAPTVPLPLDTSPGPSDAVALPRSPLAASGVALPVMVVDDSAVVRAKLSKLLTQAGYAVSTARHGQDALEQLARQWVAVLITDLEMPEMDGFELISKVSGDARTQMLPIIAITGHDDLQAKVQDARGLYGIFKKPWDDRELLQRIGVLALLRPRSG